MLMYARSWNMRIWNPKNKDPKIKILKWKLVMPKIQAVSWLESFLTVFPWTKQIQSWLIFPPISPGGKIACYFPWRSNKQPLPHVYLVVQEMDSKAQGKGLVPSFGTRHKAQGPVFDVFFVFLFIFCYFFFLQFLDFWTFLGKNMELGPKWVHMTRYELILKLDGALWLTIISKTPLTPRKAMEGQTIQNYPT